MPTQQGQPQPNNREDNNQINKAVPVPNNKVVRVQLSKVVPNNKVVRVQLSKVVPNNSLVVAKVQINRVAKVLINNKVAPNSKVVKGKINKEDKCQASKAV